MTRMRWAALLAIIALVWGCVTEPNEDPPLPDQPVPAEVATGDDLPVPFSYVLREAELKWGA